MIYITSYIMIYCSSVNAAVSHFTFVEVDIIRHALSQSKSEVD